MSLQVKPNSNKNINAMSFPSKNISAKPLIFKSNQFEDL
jgi:hypothetical protein